MKVVVTGASGKAGRAVVRDLLAHDYDVLGVDLAPPAAQLAPFLLADLTEFGQAVPYRPTEGDYDTLLSIEKAKRLLGYEPQHSWREYVSG